MDLDPDRPRDGAPVDQAGDADATEQDPGPGVHVLVTADAAGTGRRLAERLGAELDDTAVTAELAVQARLSHQQDAPAHRARDEIRRLAAEISDAPSDAAADLQLAEQLAARRAAEAVRVPTPADLPRLRDLAAAVERAERIRRRTEEATAERLATSLNTGLAVHPETLRRASAAVLEERREAAGIEAALERLGTDPGSLQATQGRGASGGSRVSIGRPAQSPTGEAAAPHVSHAPGSLLIAIGILLLGVALAGGILLSSLPPVLAVAPILLGLLIATVIRRWSREDQTERSDRARASATLENAAGPMPEGPVVDARDRSGERGPDPQRVEWTQRRDALEAQLAVVRERLEAAQRDWAGLAGDDADAADIEAVVARNDPQFGMLRDVAAETAAVRTAERVAGLARQAWESAWAELGQSAPDPESGDSFEQALSGLQQTAEGGEEPHVAMASGDGLDVEEAERATRRIELRERLDVLLGGRTLDDVLAAPPDEEPQVPRPLVLVEPFSGLGTRRKAVLKDQLDALDDRLQVILVVRDRAEIP